MECGGWTPLWIFRFMEGGGWTPLWIFGFMECGGWTPLWILALWSAVAGYRFGFLALWSAVAGHRFGFFARNPKRCRATALQRPTLSDQRFTSIRLRPKQAVLASGCRWATPRPLSRLARSHQRVPLPPLPA